MKRLIIPLVVSIALPNALYANPLSKDIIHKNPFGEKYIIKKNTLVFYKRTFGQLLSEYKKAPKYWGVGGYMQKYELENSKPSRELYKKYCLPKSDILISDFNKIRCTTWKKIIDISNEKISNYQNKSNNALAKYKNYKPYLEKFNSSKIYRINIIYTPIFEDLNNLKVIQKKKRVICLNKSLDYSRIGLKDYLSSAPQFIKNELETKICRK